MTDASLIDLDAHKKGAGRPWLRRLVEQQRAPYEVQAFSRVGLQPEVLEGLGPGGNKPGRPGGRPQRRHVFELERESFFGDESLQRAQRWRAGGLVRGGQSPSTAAAAALSKVPPSSRSALDSEARPPASDPA